MSKNIKVNNQNIIYYETVLKYLPNNEKKEFFINAMKNNIYFTEEEIKNFGNIFNKIVNFEVIENNETASYYQKIENEKYIGYNASRQNDEMCSQ